MQWSDRLRAEPDRRAATALVVTPMVRGDLNAWGKVTPVWLDYGV